MRAEMDEIYKGPTRSGKWFFGDNGAKIEKLTATPDEAQFIATMQHQVEEQCRWWGVPPQKVHHLLRMTFNNVEQLSIEVVVDSITPWAIRFEEEANFKLFGQNRAGFFVKLDLKGLLRGDFKSRQDGLQVMRQNGIITANGWAELEDMPKIPASAGGDKYIAPANYTTLERLGEPPLPPVTGRDGGQSPNPVPPPATSGKTARARISGMAVLASTGEL
jgi:HK97 family phage portal protein